ncbi:MAG: glutamyl-tRNA reductase [Desulfobacterales bacterium]|nr:glutamyl-tRNA reductase [Desulfobacterales bacterium]
MSTIVLMGLNHKTAPIELREKLAFTKEEISYVSSIISRQDDIQEIILISTCNRVEVLMLTSSHLQAIETVNTFIANEKNIEKEYFNHSLYVYYDDEAVRHLFKVASSLDSMVIGEPQILGQIKEAYRIAVSQKTSGVILNRLFHRTFMIAKRVRTETGIGDHAVSISYAAVELGRKIFGKLEGKTILLIGAGEMAELAVEHLIRNHVGQIYVANRTFERGLELANTFKGKAIQFQEIRTVIPNVDIVISSTASSKYILTRNDLKGIMKSRKNRPVFFIDISVPRNIDPEINQLPDIYVYDIDDLKGVIEDNVEQRNRESIKAERLIDEAVIQFRHWRENLEVVPTIVALKQKMEAIKTNELKKTLNTLKHLSDQDTNAIFRMTDALINKILHDPIMFLKQSGHNHSDMAYISFTRSLFNLDEMNPYSLHPTLLNPKTIKN